MRPDEEIEEKKNDKLREDSLIQKLTREKDFS
jgi:hypothetical protein